MNKVLIADNVSNAVFGVFDKYKIEYDQKVGLSEDEICAEIGNYSGLVIRSAVTVTEKIIENAQNLKVIGRPGVGVDNVDLEAASKKNIVVMNTPLGNVQATAELTFSIIHALMRNITNANQSMHNKKWEKKNNIKIGKGDILLLRTGRWEQLRQKGYWEITKKSTGFHYSVASFLKERDVAVIGCDGVSDVYPSGIKSKKDALHELVLVDLGMPIFDNMDLDSLSKNLERLNRKTFMFVANPLKIKGATGAPINPVAIY